MSQRIAKPAPKPKAAKSAAKPHSPKSSPPMTLLNYHEAANPETDSAEIIDIFTGKAVPPFLSACENLRLAVARAAPRPLPMQDQLETHFNASFAPFAAVWSQEIAIALSRLGAEAAVLDGRMALRSASVSMQTLLHEAAHLLQSARDAPAIDADLPEREADLRQTEPGPIEAAVDPSQPQFRAKSDAEADKTDWQATQDFRAAQVTADQPKQSTTEEKLSRPDKTEIVKIVPDQPAPVPTPVPVLGQTPPLLPQAEAAKRAVEQSNSALAAALTPEAYMSAYASATPSVKAAKTATLTTDLARLGQAEAEGFDTGLPSFSAKLSGEAEAPPALPPIAAPKQATAPLEPIPPAAFLLPKKPAVVPSQPFAGNGFLMSANPADAVDAKGLARLLGKIETRDQKVETSPGLPPPFPLNGEANPARISEQRNAANNEAVAKRDIAMGLVIAGRGPEQVVPVALDHPVPIVPGPRPMLLEAAAPPEGPNEFLTRKLDAETTAIFDAHNGPMMQEHLASTTAEMDKMVTDRDSQRDAAVASAEHQVATAQSKADKDQVTQINAARGDIQSERGKALQGQQDTVATMTKDVDAQSLAARIQISDRVQADEAAITTHYAAAQDKAEAKLSEADAKAAAEKEKAEAAAQNDSWWDRAADWVGDQLSKLKSLIGNIIDAVRKGISEIMDAVKTAAFAIIDAAASFVKTAIGAYGALLKIAVSGLIGQVFPDLAAALNAGIDAAVQKAKSAVEKISAGLKTVVSFIVDALEKGLNAILSFVQGALNGILAVAQAAISGDWSEVSRLILEPILAMMGIDKAVFYSYVGKAMEAIGKIVDDPIAFLKHLFDAVVGGFKLFGDNFKDHLIAGIVGWLTGTFGGSLSMPATFDLMGVLDIARQIIGLTLDMLRKVAVRVLGEKAVKQIEFFVGYASTLITDGWGAFFEKIKNDLTGLADLVMTQLTDFLMERVAKAGLVWLASLINPVGAIIKIVKMIWDFIMWLKDNLGRLMEIVKTVVGAMVDISNGVIEPASKAVESVLARLLTPTIDLLARLIGLGDISEDVKKVISGIHKTIEDAVVALIRRVLVKFTGKPAEEPTSNSDLMKPISFAGGNEAHTLHAEEHGADVVPMMHSTPMAVETWLNTLKTDAGVKVQLMKSDPQVTDQASGKKRIEIEPLVTAALVVETKMDNEGEAAQDAKAKLDLAKTATLDASAQKMAETLSAILNKLGLTNTLEFAVVFAKQIAGIDSAYQVSLNGAISRNIGADMARRVAYTDLPWSEVIQKLPLDTAILTGAFARPFHAGGVIRAQLVFKHQTVAAAKEIALTIDPNSANSFLLGEDAEDAFLTDHLLPIVQTNEARQRAFMAALTPPGTMSVVVAAIAPEIAKAVKSYFVTPTGEAPDADFKANVKKEAFLTGGLFETPDFHTKKLTYFEQQDAQGVGVPGPNDRQADLNWFLTISPKGSNKSSERAQKNITYTADMVRAAAPGKHEWILASQANAAIAATIAQMPVGDAEEKVAGIANFIRFLHEVRTDTSNILYQPDYANKLNPVKIKYVSPTDPTIQGKAPGSPEFAAARKTAYVGRPAAGSDFLALQGHAGGLKVIQLTEDGSGTVEMASEGASSAWHQELRAKNEEVLSKTAPLTVDDMRLLGDGILKILDDTTLSLVSEAEPLKAGNPQEGFALYRFKGGVKFTSFDALIEAAILRHNSAKEDLEAKINNVITT